MTADCEVANLQVVEKLKSIPTIESAVGTSADIYKRVKESNELINWALESAETALGTAVDTVAVPLANRFQQPIAHVDAKLCRGIEVLQEKIPIVKEPPAEIYDKAKTYVTSTIPPAVQSISDASIKLRDDGWNRANELLTSRYGSIALSSFDRTSAIADKCIDYCLPPEERETDVHQYLMVSYEDKLKEAVQHVLSMPGKFIRQMSEKFNQSITDFAPNSLDISFQRVQQEFCVKEDGVAFFVFTAKSECLVINSV